MDDASRFGPATEPAHNVATVNFRVRRLSPAFAHLRVYIGQTWMDDPENECVHAIFHKVGIGPKSDRWPRATGLVSYLSSCFFALRRTIPIRNLPQIELIAKPSSPANPAHPGKTLNS